MKRTFAFTFVLDDDPRDLLDWSNALFEAGGDDSSPREHCGIPYVAFDREAESFEEAVRSARECILAAGLRILRCEIEEAEMHAWSAHAD